MLLSLIGSAPTEFADRIRTYLEGKTDRRQPRIASYLPVPLVEALAELEGKIHQSIADYLDEPAVLMIEREVTQRIEELRSQAPFRLSHNADLSLGRLCYAICRAVQPEIVVETGTGYGVTTSFLLAALAENQRGQLHSVDLPPLAANADSYVGWLIPNALRTRWRLHRGSSRRVLPPLLDALPPVDVFVHDSLHTYAHMRWEFEQVERHLADEAILLADDAEDNAAFAEWGKREEVIYSKLVADDDITMRYGISAEGVSASLREPHILCHPSSDGAPPMRALVGTGSVATACSTSR